MNKKKHFTLAAQEISNMETQILENITLFNAEEFDRDVRDIRYDSMIERDLGIYGDDAFELIVGFRKNQCRCFKIFI